MAAPSPAPPAPPPSAVDPLPAAASRAVAEARAAGRSVLLSWTRPLQAPPPGRLLRALAAGDPPRHYFVSPAGEELAGLGAAVSLEGDGGGRFDAIRLRAEALLGGAVVAAEGAGAPGPRFLGGFAFDDVPAGGPPWDGFPAARFVLPHVAWARGPGGAWVTVNRLVEGREDPADLARHFAVQAARAEQPVLDAPRRAGVPLPAFGSRLVERGEWVKGVEQALAAIRGKVLAKVVLARRATVPLTGPLDGPSAVALLGPRYPECFRYLVEPQPGKLFLGASPELLVRLRGLEAETAAVAGSAPRGPSAAEDEALARDLAASPKERAEHDFVVAHLQERLASLGAEVEAPARPGLLRLRNVQHLHTPVRARLATPSHVLDLAAALHPTPAVAGSPVPAALRFLRDAEAFPRGWYAGAVGWFDGQGQGEFAVALRCALVDRDEAWLFAGAGIVAGADPGREWDETALKLEPMLEALGCRP